MLNFSIFAQEKSVLMSYLKYLSFFALLVCMSFVAEKPKKDVHPYHVGSVELNYSNKSKTFEIVGRFFIDDLENALNDKSAKKVHFQDTKHRNEMQEALKKYSAEHLKLKVNGEFVQIKFLGFEEDSEGVDLYLESAVVTNPKKVETAISYVYNLYDDQTNIIHIIVGGNRKSSKLTYPNRYLFQQF